MEVPFEYFVIAVSVLAGFLALRGKKVPFYLRLFPYFLLITLANEILSWQLSLRGIANAFLYNAFSVGAFVFYMYILSEAIHSRVAKRWIFYVMIVYVAASVYNMAFGQGMDVFNTITYSVGCFLIVAISIFYFLELFQRPRYIDLKKQPTFWIVSGLLFFYACTPALFGVLNYLDSLHVNLTKLMPLITIMNVSLYSLFTIAFLCRINFKRSMS